MDFIEKNGFPKDFRGCTLWLTGFSGAGKTTIASALHKWLSSYGFKSYVLDGDDFRRGLNSDLGFTKGDRKENIRRIAEIAKIFSKRGEITITSLISPYREDRQFAKFIHQNDGLSFLECFVDTPFEICELRDVKGLYKRARAGELKYFTGIDSPYEKPQNPDLIINTVNKNVKECIEDIISLLEKKKIIPRRIQPLYVENDIETLQEQVEKLPLIEMNKIDLQWLQVLAEGWATPLKGFMKEKELLQCLRFTFICKNGIQSQAIPIILAVDSAVKNELQGQDLIALSYKGIRYAILKNPEFYKFRKEEFSALMFGTIDPGHPTIKKIMESGNYLVGGEVAVIRKIIWNDGLDKYRLTPLQIRDKIEEFKADTVYAFQLRNPIHNGHELLISETRKKLIKKGYNNPLLLLHPLGGWTKEDDVPLHIRIKQHEAILQDNILDSQRTILAIFPSPMTYAGPREVLWHCKARSILGINYYIVGRDPAGIKHPSKEEDLFDPTHGYKLLEIAPGLSDRVKILPFKVAAYSIKNQKMEFFDENRANEYEFISGTKMRNIAKNREKLPDGFMAPKAWNILEEYYKNLS